VYRPITLSTGQTSHPSHSIGLGMGMEISGRPLPNRVHYTSSTAARQHSALHVAVVPIVALIKACPHSLCSYSGQAMPQPVATQSTPKKPWRLGEILDTGRPGPDSTGIVKTREAAGWERAKHKNRKLAAQVITPARLHSTVVVASSAILFELLSLVSSNPRSN
jgi:hypothetical protein